MKNRRITIVAFLLIAALTLGFGYAAVTNVLDIQGSASVSATAAEAEFNENVYFKGVKKGEEIVQSVIASDNLGYTANINANNNDKAQFTVTGLEKSGDKYSITFVIQNDSSFDASVKVKTNTNTNTANFAFTNSLAANTITAGGTVEVTVTVELITELTSAASGSFVIELDVTAGEASQGE